MPKSQSLGSLKYTQIRWRPMDNFEIESTHETYDNKNYFDLLRTPQSNKRELRAKYTEMVRKFHPDTLGSKRLSPEVMSKADVSHA